MNENFESNYIPIIESKIIFNEIMANYYSGNYRSCIVSVNTLLYYDLMFKLRDLKEKYNFKKAVDILGEIDSMILINEKYSQVELKLMQLSLEKGVINKHFFDRADDLRNLRNECAHLGFKDNQIYVPTKAEVLMYIDFLYDELLTKHAVNYYDAVNYFLEEIEAAYEKNISADDKSLRERTMRSYSKIDNKNLQKLFNSLFILTVIKNNEETMKYQEYSYNYMYWLTVYMKSKKIAYNLSVLSKLNIQHLDDSYFKDKNYNIKMFIDGIITLDDINDNNNEILELYKDTLLGSRLIYQMYNKLFSDLNDFINYLKTSDKVNFAQLYNVVHFLDEVKTEEYMNILLKRMIELTPEKNGFDKSDLCLEKFVENHKILALDKKEELLYLMSQNNQFFNLSKNKTSEYKKKIAEIYNEEFDELIERIAIKFIF